MYLNYTVLRVELLSLSDTKIRQNNYILIKFND
jgi:hypothetical protein